MFSPGRDQAEGLRRIFYPAAPAVIPLACAGEHGACRRYAAVVLDRLERVGGMPRLVDRLDDGQTVMPSFDGDARGRVLLLDDPVRLARWLAGRQSRMLVLLSHCREALPAQYAMIKAVAAAGEIREFGTFFVDAADAGDADLANQRLALCAERFLKVQIYPVNRVAGSLAAMIDASLAHLQDYAVALANAPLMTGRDENGETGH